MTGVTSGDWLGSLQLHTASVRPGEQIAGLSCLRSVAAHERMVLGAAPAPFCVFVVVSVYLCSAEDRLVFKRFESVSIAVSNWYSYGGRGMSLCCESLFHSGSGYK